MKRLLLMACCCITTVEAAALDYRLRYDPFATDKPVIAQGNRNAVDHSLELRAVILDGEGSLANINGELIKLNGRVSGYTLTAIERSRVVLERNGHSTILNAANYEKDKD